MRFAEAGLVVAWNVCVVVVDNGDDGGDCCDDGVGGVCGCQYYHLGHYVVFDGQLDHRHYHVPYL